jgi:S-formylglutathione hydrolase FrmB
VRAFASLLIIAGVFAVAGGGVAAGHPVETDRALYSPAVEGRLAVRVYLPASYASDRRRYPVVYFLHGLPASSTAYRGSRFIADALAQAQRDAIIVAPQAARDGDSDPEYLDWGRARNWETALDRDVVNYVDSHFRTIATRRGRALLGLSAGGYGAMILALHNLDSFSVVESWSGYFHATDPSGVHPLQLGSASRTRRASAHTYVPSLKHATAQRPTFIAFYVGTEDKRFRAENEQFDDELSKARVPHVFKLYPGGHEQRVWTQHAGAWLALALSHLAPAR